MASHTRSGCSIASVLPSNRALRLREAFACLLVASLAVALWPGGQVVRAAEAPAGGPGPGEQSDAFTPVVASPLASPPVPVKGADGKMHLVYELELVNAGATPATLSRVAVLDASEPTDSGGAPAQAGVENGSVIAPFEGDALLERLAVPGRGGADSLVLGTDEVRVLLVDIALDASTPLPRRLAHRLELSGAASPAAAEPTPLEYTLAPVELGEAPIELGPPLRGERWIAVNGCCSPRGVHRSTLLPVNGTLACAQRYAIDWMQMDEQGRLVVGDPARVESYTSYGAEVLSVADGVIVETLDGLPNQTPGKLPDPASINLRNVDGNHVIVDLGSGRYAFYAHLAPGSVRVKPGDRVRRGQILGLLGNSGNTSAPHLHFHLMDGPSALGSSGLPYVLGQFALMGKVSAEQFAAAETLVGDWGQGLLAQPVERERAFPVDLDVVAFGE